MTKQILSAKALMTATFLDLHRKHIHLFNPLLQLVLSRRCNGVHVVVASIILLV